MTGSYNYYDIMTNSESSHGVIGLYNHYDRTPNPEPSHGMKGPHNLYNFTTKPGPSLRMTGLYDDYRNSLNRLKELSKQHLTTKRPLGVFPITSKQQEGRFTTAQKLMTNDTLRSIITNEMNNRNHTVIRNMKIYDYQKEQIKSHNAFRLIAITINSGVLYLQKPSTNIYFKQNLQPTALVTTSIIQFTFNTPQPDQNSTILLGQIQDF